MKIITLKSDGRLEHLWLPEIHKSIPVNAISVTDEIYSQLSNNPLSKFYDPEQELVKDFLPSFDFAKSLQSKHYEITQKFKQAMSPITGIYTDEDIASFPTQEAEAKAWQADNTAATPFIDGLLANRPTVDKATLVQRILDNASTYKSVAGPAIGKKQHYEDLLYALKGQHEDPEQPDVTKADIDTIVVDYS